MSSSEIFAALFELELTGKVRRMPGKNFVKSFYHLASDPFEYELSLEGNERL
jgi:DprA/Smf-like nucleotide binding protein involved in DNA uptake